MYKSTSRPNSFNDSCYKEKASPSSHVTKAGCVSNTAPLIVAALKAMFLLIVMVITIEMHFDHHFIIDCTSVRLLGEKDL